ncbi:MAG: hypothetical protein Q9201_002305 [Fulgogasparrea decipioides]
MKIFRPNLCLRHRLNGLLLLLLVLCAQSATCASRISTSTIDHLGTLPQPEFASTIHASRQLAPYPYKRAVVAPRGLKILSSNWEAIQVSSEAVAGMLEVYDGVGQFVAALDPNSLDRNTTLNIIYGSFYFSFLALDYMGHQLLDASLARTGITVDQIKACVNHMKALAIRGLIGVGKYSVQFVALNILIGVTIYIALPGQPGVYEDMLPRITNIIAG